jgi:hypothetical protein
LPPQGARQTKPLLGATQSLVLWARIFTKNIKQLLARIPLKNMVFWVSVQTLYRIPGCNCGLMSSITNLAVKRFVLKAFSKNRWQCPAEDLSGLFGKFIG